MSGWQAAADWWLREIANDDIFESDVLPLVEHACGHREGMWLDLGAGNGRTSAALDGDWISCDISETLLVHVGGARRPVVCRLPDLEWLKDGAIEGAVAVLVIEHVAPIAELFRQVYRAVRPGGRLAVAMNHPAFTADGAGPVVDVDDGEVLWRWGAYFDAHDVVFDSDGAITFHHRPLADVLNAAAGAGWRLALVEERALSSVAVGRHPAYEGQETIPRLLGLRWERG